MIVSNTLSIYQTYRKTMEKQKIPMKKLLSIHVSLTLNGWKVHKKVVNGTERRMRRIRIISDGIFVNSFYAQSRSMLCVEEHEESSVKLMKSEIQQQVFKILKSAQVLYNESNN